MMQGQGISNIIYIPKQLFLLGMSLLRAWPGGMDCKTRNLHETWI